MYLKNSSWLIALALVTLASCTSEETVGLNTSDSISFRASLSKGGSARGVEMGATHLTKFYVTAVDEHSTVHFWNRIFQKEGNIFHLPNNEHFQWPSNGDLTFYAYAFTPVANMPGNDDQTAKGLDKFNENLSKALGADSVVITGTKQTIEGFSPNTNIAAQLDLVAAKATGNSSNAANGLMLNFNHKLVQIEVKAKSDNHVYGFNICGVKYGNIGSKATFNFNGTIEKKNTWSLNMKSGVYDVANYEVTYGEPILLDAEAVDISNVDKVGRAMLIPQTLTPWNTPKTKDKADKGAYIAVKLQIFNKRIMTQVFPDPTLEGEAGKYGWAMIPVNTTWLPGNRYIYTLDFTEGAGYDENGDPILKGPIYFQTTLSDWKSATPPEIDTPMSTDSNTSGAAEEEV